MCVCIASLAQQIVQGGAARLLQTAQVSSVATGTSQGLPYGALLLCGAATGATVWSVMFPIDVVKSKVQAVRGPAVAGALAVALAHWKSEGIGGFFKGSFPPPAQFCLLVFCLF